MPAVPARQLARATTAVALALGASQLWPGSANHDEGCRPAEQRRDVAVMQEWLAGLTNGTGPRLDLLSEDFVLRVPESLPYGGTYTKDQQDEYGEANAEAWLAPTPGAAPRLDSTCGEVVLQGRFTRTARQTGRSVDVPLVEIFEIDRGQISGDTLYLADTAPVVAALAPDAPR